MSVLYPHQEVISPIQSPWLPCKLSRCSGDSIRNSPKESISQLSTGDFLIPTTKGHWETSSIASMRSSTHSGKSLSIFYKKKPSLMRSFNSLVETLSLRIRKLSSRSLKLLERISFNIIYTSSYILAPAMFSATTTRKRGGEIGGGECVFTWS